MRANKLLGTTVNMNINVCEARIEKAIEISDLTAELGYEANEENTKEWLNYLLSSENHCVFIALNEFNSVCGWVVVEKRISLETGFKAEITGLIVGEKYRRFGVGKKLISEAISWAKSLNLTKLVVRSNIQREESHVFYRSIGFNLKKTAHNYELGI
ncbi:MAG: GNAT family N-acetyltransferase [Shewanella sp.]